MTFFNKYLRLKQVLRKLKNSCFKILNDKFKNDLNRLLTGISLSLTKVF